VDLEMGHYTVTVISESFAGMRPVARQQRVYAPLADIIADGAIHAVNIRAMTPAEAG
jgi:acid stress-induced BolA-like protein IbaG/YrbA